MTASLCARHPYDPAMWDYEVAGETAKQRRKRHDMAAQVCGRCPVAAACRAVATPGISEGVWGGQVFPEIPMSSSALYEARRVAA